MEGEAKEQEKQAQEQTEQDAAQGAAEGAQGASESEVKDSHGQPGINKERHDKEVADLQARIDDLTAKLNESAKTEESRKNFEAEAKALREELADNKLSHALELAGCLDLKAAKVRLDDFNGDVSKLKAECPYLFQQQKKGATGAKPQGATDGAADRLAKARELVGVRKK